MAGKQQISDELKSAILADLKAGETFTAIRDKYSVSLWTVNEIAKLNGIKREKGREKGCEYLRYKHERLGSHYFFKGYTNQLDVFIENCF